MGNWSGIASNYFDGRFSTLMQMIHNRTGLQHMNPETFHINLQDVFVDGCKRRIHIFSPTPGISTVKIESRNQTVHKRRQNSTFSSSQISIFASDVWPSCINSSFVKFALWFCLFHVEQVGFPEYISLKYDMWYCRTSWAVCKRSKRPWTS